MKCAKCGTEIKPGCVYCSACGQELQIVRDTDLLEDEFLSSMLLKDDGMDRGDDIRNRGVAAKPGGEGKKSDLGNQKKRRKRKRLILILVLVIAALLAVFGTVRYMQEHSVSYLLDHGEQYYNTRNYKLSADYLDKALALDPDNEKALLLRGEIYAATKDTDNAEKTLLRLLETDPTEADAYRVLLRIYANEDNYSKIVSLSQKTTDKTILALFDNYLVKEPEFSVSAGSYTDYLSIAITSSQQNGRIFYTLDGSTPTKKSTEYKSSEVKLSKEGTTTLKAVCMDTDGHYSTVATAAYNITLAVPDQPSVTPDGGTFTSQQTITVTVPSGVTVYYTWDGSKPTKHSAKYTEPLEIPGGNNILSLIAVDENGKSSEVLKCNYIYYPAD